MSACQQCGTPLLHRYLWLTNPAVELKPGERLADRYYVVQDQILLDTRPGFNPTFPLDIYERWLPYLRLVKFSAYIPRIYGILSSDQPDQVLLEQAPIYTTVATQDLKGGHGGQLMPRMVDVWSQVSPLRQLNLLWQVLKLWPPFEAQGVAQSLLEPDLIRVDGGQLHLLELQLKAQTLTLANLAEHWQALLPGTHESLQPLLEPLLQIMHEGRQQDYPKIMMLLEQALAIANRHQVGQITIATRTDVGSSRHHNEDTCYPDPQQPITTINPNPPQADLRAITVVCDGLGGHERGEVASQLALDTFVTFLDDYWQASQLQGQAAQERLRRALLEANQAVEQANGNEILEERQRMGTTLVSAAILRHLLYIGHVGDSRAYWISPRYCRQLTTDDNLVTRYMQLGMGCYRQLLGTPSAGALVQALGMLSEQELEPNVQVFCPDEDAIILLCSDGLSDRERVEEIWSHTLLPVLQGQLGLAEVADRLIALGNRLNGHDNITVALLHYQVTGQKPLKASDFESLWPRLGSKRSSQRPAVSRSSKRHANHLIQRSASESSPNSKDPLHNLNTLTAGAVTPLTAQRPAIVWSLLVLAAVAIGLGVWFFVSPLPNPTSSDSLQELR